MFEQLCCFCLMNYGYKFYHEFDSIEIVCDDVTVLVKREGTIVEKFETIQEVESYLIKKIIDKDLCQEFMLMLLGDN